MMRRPSTARNLQRQHIRRLIPGSNTTCSVAAFLLLLDRQGPLEREFKELDSLDPRQRSLPIALTVAAPVS
jgi:hypothetical protein